jgi:hypothetical protein
MGNGTNVELVRRVIEDEVELLDYRRECDVRLLPSKRPAKTTQSQVQRKGRGKRINYLPMQPRIPFPHGFQEFFYA